MRGPAVNFPRGSGQSFRKLLSRRGKSPPGAACSLIMMMKPALVATLLLSTALPLRGVIIDRIAAIVDAQVITVSDIDQLVTLRVFVPTEGESQDEFRRRVLETMIAQTLRRRDLERFGAPRVSPDAVAARLRQVASRFPGEEAFTEALTTAEMTLGELEAILTRQLELEAYIDERFAPLVFISLAEIERYYEEEYLPQRASRGLPARGLDEVREELRSALRAERLTSELELWTTQLRERANVDIYTW